MLPWALALKAPSELRYVCTIFMSILRSREKSVVRMLVNPCDFR